MTPPTPTPPQDRVQRWVVRRGPFIAAVVITAGVAAKTLSLIFAIFSLPVSRTDFLGVLDKVDQVPWPVAILMLLAAWMTVFLGAPLWQKYLSYQHRWRQWDKDTTEDGRPATHSSKRARTRRQH